MNSELVEEHELIQFELTWVDKVFLIWSIVTTFAAFFFLPYITTFNDVWIWGMPRPAFGLVLFAIVNAFLTLAIQLLYRNYFSKLK